MYPIFDSLPTIDRLSYLTSGTLSQPNNLAKALRLWSILQTLYSEDNALPERCFTPAQWRNHHFPEAFPQDSVQVLLDQAGVDFATWSIDYRQRYPKEAIDLPQRLSEIPFQVSDRTLRNDFVTLADLGWLEIQGSGRQRQYQRVQTLPNLDRLTPAAAITTSQIIPNELTLVADQFFTPINGEQRFILDIENVMSSDLTSQLNHFTQQLKQIWQAASVVPIKLKYRSARRFQDEFAIVTYPVCIHYCQRAPYLFAYGQTPASIEANQPNLTEWYDYRLDHILSLEPLTWDHVPAAWKTKRWSGQGVPSRFIDKTPQRVFNEVSQALGYEIYRPIAPLLLRFDRYFFANYIEGTEREKLFTQLEIKQVERMFNLDPAIPEDLQFQQLLGSRTSHRKDIFCRIDHRIGDNNVVMRLRAWGDNVEVLLPWSLRERMRDDLTKAQSFYRTP
jgi:CRISPR-associated protein (TIGR03985 family)